MSETRLLRDGIPFKLQVSQLLGRHLPRLHSELRKVKLLETGWGLNIVTPPEPRDGKVCAKHPSHRKETHKPVLWSAIKNLVLANKPKGQRFCSF